MKYIIFLAAMAAQLAASAQIQLSTDEQAKLIEISDQFNVNTQADIGPLKKIGKNTPERFKTMVDGMMAIQGLTEKMLEPKYIGRPSHEDLVYWYVVCKLQQNKFAKDSLKKTQDYIVKSVLRDTIDERLLLDNYYYMLSSGLSFLFNTADLSKYNFELDELGFKDDTEKAIFFLSMVDACARRLQIMNQTKKGDPIGAINRLPKVNGKYYYYYSAFDYPDFKWIRNDKVEDYNETNVGIYYVILFSHLMILIEKKYMEDARLLYRNSILSQPDYYKYSVANRSTLEKLHEAWK